MEKYIILPDVTCDLSKEIRDFFGIEDYVPSHITFRGAEYPTTLDWDHFSREEFYKVLSDRGAEITTAPASPGEFYEVFKKYTSEGYKVLFMSISSKISSTVSVATEAARRIVDDIPGATVYVFDSMKMTGALGLLVVQAFRMQREGKSFGEVVSWLENNKHRVHQMGPIDDLIFVARRGRISMGKAVMGSFAGVKPMGDCNLDGYTSVLAKAKGMKKALVMTANYVKRMAKDVENNYIIISHSDRAEYAEKLKELIEERMQPLGIFISDIYCGCGTHIGPGMVGAYFFGDMLSADLEKERAVLQNIADSL